MNSKLNNGDRGDGTAKPEWLAGLMLQRDRRLLSRFVFYYRELQRQPRRWRRMLQRKLALTVTGAALLLALAGGTVATNVLAEPIGTDAIITVVDGEVAINDNNKCSLIEAIINARTTKAGQLHDDCAAGNLNGPDTVVLPTNGEFVLTAAHNEVYGPTGLPIITSAVIIEGNGSTIRREDDNEEYFRILAVDTEGSLTLRDATLTNGAPNSPFFFEYEVGGAILSNGNLTVEGSTISHNTAYIGGGIWATTATITGSRIIDNKARGEYGGVAGGIRASYLTLVDSIVAGNIAHGGEEWADTGGGYGGGISMFHGTISGSTITGNQATNGNDGQNYDEPVPGMGGGINIRGTVTIVNSTISQNEANFGGGLFVTGNVSLINTTVSGNNARIDIGGYYDDDVTGGYGGGVYVNGTSRYDYGYCGSAVLRNTLIAGNTAEYTGRELFVEGANDFCVPTASANSFNVFGHNGNAGLVGLNKGATDVVPSAGLAAILSPLADNGGPTPTYALPTGSPALDVAPNASCASAPVNGVDQRGRARNANGKGGASTNECDAGSFELQAAGGGGQAFLISPSGNGAVGGVSFTSSDILKYDPATGWSTVFDGSDVGITKNLSAFEVLDNGHILMSFAGNQPIPGVGTFAPQDIARFVPTTSGEATTGTFQLALRGSDNLLTTSGEKIDALADIGDGRWAISTTGTAAVRLPDGTPLKAQDEDALGLNPDTGEWSPWFDGTPIPGLKSEDVNAMWIDPTTGDIYVGIVGSFNLGGVKGNGRDIVKLTKTPGAPGGYVPSLWWGGSAAGFPTNIDGLEIMP